MGLRPMTPADGAVLGLHAHTLAEQDLRVPAADRREVQKALLVDVSDDEADLVDVADDREERLCVGIADPRDGGAERVARAHVGERCGIAPDVVRGALVAGGPRGTEKVAQ